MRPTPKASTPHTSATTSPPGRHPPNHARVRRRVAKHVAQFPPRGAAFAALAVVPSGHDWYAFTVACKGVFLEGPEVAFIVLSPGRRQGSMGLAAVGAPAALLVESLLRAVSGTKR